MTQFEQLDTILEGQCGMLQTLEAVKRGIPKSVFYRALAEEQYKMRFFSFTSLYHPVKPQLN